MKRYIEWILVAFLIGIFMYLGSSQFHLKHFRIFIFMLIPMVFVIEVFFRWVEHGR